RRVAAGGFGFGLVRRLRHDAGRGGAAWSPLDWMRRGGVGPPYGEEATLRGGGPPIRDCARWRIADHGELAREDPRVDRPRFGWKTDRDPRRRRLPRAAAE